MKRIASTIALVGIATLAPAAHATQCFSVFDARNTLVYQSTTSPVDLSGPVSNAMARRYPSRSLVIADSGICREVGTAPVTAITLRGGSSQDAPGDGSLSFDTIGTGPAMASSGRDGAASGTTRRSRNGARR